MLAFIRILTPLPLPNARTKERHVDGVSSETAVLPSTVFTPRRLAVLFTGAEHS